MSELFYSQHSKRTLFKNARFGTGYSAIGWPKNRVWGTTAKAPKS